MTYHEVFQGYTRVMDCQKCDAEGLDFDANFKKWGGERYTTTCPNCGTTYVQVPDSYAIMEKTDD